MSIRTSALMTAGLLGALLILGSYAAHAGDGFTTAKMSAATAVGWGTIELPAAGRDRS